MSCACWKQLLDILSPIAVVLAAPLAFQVGFFWALLEYNDQQTMLGGCKVFAFDCKKPTQAESLHIRT